MRAYKLFKKRRNGTLGPLFINTRMVVDMGVWLEAEDHPTKGFAHRPGWHATLKPVAPHLSENPKSGPQRVWVEVEIEDYTEFQRPISQGGTWVLAKRMKVLRELDSQDLVNILTEDWER